MKIPSCCWLVLLCASLVPPPVLALPGFRALPEGSSEQDTYVQARQLAVGWLLQAGPSMGRRDGRLAQRAAEALQRVRFSASTDARSRQACEIRQLSLFVKPSIANEIFICDEVRRHASRPTNDALLRIAQGFVHEAVHLTGELDECVATHLERQVMQQTVGIQSEGSRLRYGAQCRGRY